ncbi:MAG: hypothetical protein A2912_01550 [Candidatus Buchananbacteria bacterium RIFCSPLOWO2_01_FULL_40_23b]|uniref:HEPN domain-containing protein n=1 Tax=Candidatus Buchananbacteria bacterium RIFCSPLOWO2_01_FULL_40_23b TaxID=1797544 RepID=A0A1G1YSX9_9BACT|nr:MAG: hypothetical protein A2912_01550 [Candidatus Buchananbacteria bacterium RIFCSPLOWO2_01_FULL_40_23b]
MTTTPKIVECFSLATKDEGNGKKHKGLLFVGRDDIKAEEYVQKAKVNLLLCELFKKERMDYKIPEEWFYSQYYCALAILAKFGVESRSQKCTALFLRYVKDTRLIEYGDEFIDRIMVYKEKNEETDVDEREKARYGSSVQSEEIMQRYNFMMDVCKRCISACEEIVFSDTEFRVPRELLE